MPLTAFQREVARLLATHRNPDSHLGGGAAINRADASPRYSVDLDIFHDVEEMVATCAEADAKVLQAAGYSVEWVHLGTGGAHYKAEVTRGDDLIRLDWTFDSAFRFFPVEPDADFGYCLHQADIAINKTLALAGRAEVRDFLDILYLDETYLGLGALTWAACGKDPGYTPSLLLDYANRHARFRESDLEAEHLARPIDLRELKTRWIDVRERAASLVARLPIEELGCLYLDPDNKPVTPDPGSPNFTTLKRHEGSVRGAWPTLS